MMQASVLSILAILSTVTVSQKYKKILITTKNEIKQAELTPENGTMLFEMKTCNNTGIKLFKQLPITNEAVYRIKPYKGGKIFFYKYPRDAEFVAQNTYPFAIDCAKFFKYRISWTQELALSVVTPTGWQMLLTWEDPEPYRGGFKWISLFGLDAEWKIYQIEHTTSPFRVTCVNF